MDVLIAMLSMLVCGVLIGAFLHWAVWPSLRRVGIHVRQRYAYRRLRRAEPDWDLWTKEAPRKVDHE